MHVCKPECFAVFARNTLICIESQLLFVCLFFVCLLCSFMVVVVVVVVTKEFAFKQASSDIT